MKKGKVLPVLLAICLFFSIMYILFKYEDYYKGLTGNDIKQFKNNIKFYFYDEKTNCPLDGYLFVEDKLIGKTAQGYFNLSYEKYLSNFQKNKNISLFGKLGDCFKSNMLFDESWINPEISESYFLQDYTFNFKADIDYNNPNEKELTAFVRPSEVRSELNNINTKGETIDVLPRINNYLSQKIKYTQEEDNYWQIPSQTISLSKGDCEDYSTTLLSLFLAYNNSLNCYNIIFTSHVTTFCKIDKDYFYYDQNKIDLKKEITYRTAQERKGALKVFNNDYFRHYGLLESETAAYAFNNYELIKFNNNEDYSDWQSTLKEKQGVSLLEKTEYEYQKIEKNITEEKTKDANEEENMTQVELRTQKPILYENKPSLIGFVKKYTILFISLAVFLVVLLLLIFMDRIKII
jgi:hypothetical protein